MKIETTIRLATLADIEKIMNIEMSALGLFSSLPVGLLIQMPADLPLYDENYYQKLVSAGTSWVICNHDEPVGFLCATRVEQEQALHIVEFDVAFSFQGKGLGKKLLYHVIDFAKNHSFLCLTLTTFKAVPWNAPFYQKCGFTIIDERKMTKRLQHILKAEYQMGLPAHSRCGMEMNL